MDDRPISRGGSAVAWAMGAFILLSLTAAITSDGFLIADAATHFLFARYAIHNPFYLVNVWGRPLTSGLYAPAAALAGRLGVRCVSLLCALVCAFMAWRIALVQRYRWPALAAVFTLGQPLLYLHSFSELTELPFAALLGIAFWAYQTRRWAFLAVAASLLPLGRPEGFAFCALAGVALICHRRTRWLPLLLLPTIGWCYAGWAVEGHNGPWWRWLITAWPYGAGSDYHRGLLLHFVLVLPMVVSPLALPAVWIGMGRGLRPGEKNDHLARCQWLIAAMPLTVLVAHSLFYWLGRFSSDGEPRYLLIVAPLWGLLAAHGWEWICDRLAIRRPVSRAALAVLLPWQLNWFVPIVPVLMDAHDQSARQLVAWYQGNLLRRHYPRLLFTDPAIDYFLNARADDPMRSTPWERETFAALPSGTLLIWDSQYAVRNADSSRDVTPLELISRGWREITPPVSLAGDWRLFVSSPLYSAAAR